MKAILCMALALTATIAHAQSNYEIQVYGAETVAPRATMVELHSNFTAVSNVKPDDGTLPTRHAEHETLEVTQGLNEWSEVGFYVFTSEQNGHGVQWVGDHIRPRVRVPEQWHWPVGVSLSSEIGYQRADYDADTWTWELRPIVDQHLGRWYWAVNPAFERALHGPGIDEGMDFTPAAKLSYEFTKKASGGIEYYGDYGNVRHIKSLHDQQQQIFAVADLDLSPQWEINLGAGIGPTAATDRWLIKGIVGRRFDWKKRRP